MSVTIIHSYLLQITESILIDCSYSVIRKMLKYFDFCFSKPKSDEEKQGKKSNS